MPTNTKGATGSTVAPSNPSTAKAAPSKKDYTATAGVLAIANLLDGQPAGDIAILPEPHKHIAESLAARRNGTPAPEIFEAELNKLSDKREARAIRAAVIEAGARRARHDNDDDDQADNDVVELPLEADVPALPAAAELPDKLRKDLDTAGQWLTDYKRTASKASPMSAPEHHEVLGLMLASTAIARRLYALRGVTQIFSNLYAFIVGSSGDSKSSATDFGNLVLDKAGLSPLLLPGYMSPQGLMAELIGRQDIPTDEDDEAREARKTRQTFSAQRTWILDEGSEIFEWFGQDAMKGHKFILRRLYDCAPVSENVVSRGAGIARNTYLSLCAISTPTDLAPFFRMSAHWGNGVWARFIFSTATWDKPPYVFGDVQHVIPNELPAQLNKLAFTRLPPLVST